MVGRVLLLLLIIYQVSLAQAEQSDKELSSRRYGVLSLIGDALGVVMYQGQTGTRLSTKTDHIQLADYHFDKVALLAASDAFEKYSTNGTPVLIAPSASLYASRQGLLREEKYYPPAEITSKLKEQHATHLLLITKHRGQALLQLANASTGSGSLEGIGYYIDYNFKIRRSDTQEMGVGFLAPYVYIKVAMIDLEKSLIVREKVITKAITLSAARSKDSRNPWEVLSSEEKLELLRKMIRTELLEAIPHFIN